MNEYYRYILDNLPGGLVSVDMTGKVIYINPMAGRILHFADAAVCLDKKYSAAFRNFPALTGVIQEAISTGKTVRRTEISIMHADTPMQIGYSTMHVRNSEGKEMGVTVVFQDISFAGAKNNE